MVKLVENVRNKKIFNGIVNILFYFCFLLILFSVLRIFAISSFVIPSDSMEPSLEEGDHILVNKLFQGGRIFNINATLNNKEFKIKRLPGYGKLNYNDIVVFNFPYSKSSWDSISFDIMRYYVKRCIALPGDTLEIKNGFYKFLNKEITVGNLVSQRIISTLSDSCKYVEMKTYPFNKKMNWTVKEFGPLAIPFKGQIIDMDSTAQILYHQLVLWEQKKKLTRQDNEVFLGDSIIHQYQFKENYYFVSGDKLENSQDSRYWGLLPESFIVGKATTIWNSKNPLTGKIRWDRVLKRIK